MKMLFKTLLMIVILFTFVNMCIFVENKSFASDSEFIKFNFKIKKVSKKFERKVEIVYEWDTQSKIIITSVESKIFNQIQKEAPKNACTYNENTNLWHNKIVSEIESWQIGTMKVVINYMDEELHEYSKTFYISGGKWLNDGVRLQAAIFSGIFVSFCVTIGTVIIIENKKKNYNSME